MTKPTTKVSRLAFIVAAGLAISGCSYKDSYRGYMFDPALSDAIMVGVDNRLSVESTLGSPTLQSTFDKDVWYYVRRIDNNRSFFWPRPKERRVMMVRFDDGGNVSEVTNYNLSHARDINPVSDKTPSRGRDLNFFQELFMNVGRFVGAGGGQGAGGPGPNGS